MQKARRAKGVLGRGTVILAGGNPFLRSADVVRPFSRPSATPTADLINLGSRSLLSSSASCLLRQATHLRSVTRGTDFDLDDFSIRGSSLRDSATQFVIINHFYQACYLVSIFFLTGTGTIAAAPISPRILSRLFVACAVTLVFLFTGSQ